MASQYPMSQVQQSHQCAFQSDQQHVAVPFAFPTRLYKKQTKKGFSGMNMEPKIIESVRCSTTNVRVKIHRLSSLAKVHGRMPCEQRQLLDQHLHGPPQQYEQSHLLSSDPTLEKFCLM